MCYLKPRHFKRCHLHVKYLTAHRVMCGEVEVKQKGIRPTPLPVLATLFMVRTDANFYGKRPCFGENFASLGGFGIRGHVILPDQGYSNRADGTIHGSALL